MESINRTAPHTVATLLLDTTVHQVQPLQLRPCGSDMFHTRRRRPRHNSHQPQSDQTRGRPNVDTKRAPPNSGGARWYTSEAIFTRTSPPEAPKKCGHLASVLLIGNKMSTCPRLAVVCQTVTKHGCGHPPGGVHTPLLARTSCNKGLKNTPKTDKMLHTEHKMQFF